MLELSFMPALNRPDENITGVTWFGGDMAGKRLHDVIPSIRPLGY
jgi:hypothetical protein